MSYLVEVRCVWTAGVYFQDSSTSPKRTDVCTPVFHSALPAGHCWHKSKMPLVQSLENYSLSCKSIEQKILLNQGFHKICKFFSSIKDNPFKLNDLPSRCTRYAQARVQSQAWNEKVKSHRSFSPKWCLFVAKMWKLGGDRSTEDGSGQMIFILPRPFDWQILVTVRCENTSAATWIAVPYRQSGVVAALVLQRNDTDAKTVPLPTSLSNSPVVRAFPTNWGLLWFNEVLDNI